MALLLKNRLKAITANEGNAVSAPLNRELDTQDTDALTLKSFLDYMGISEDDTKHTLDAKLNAKLESIKTRKRLPKNSEFNCDIHRLY